MAPVRLHLRPREPPARPERGGDVPSRQEERPLPELRDGDGPSPPGDRHPEPVRRRLRGRGDRAVRPVHSRPGGARARLGRGVVRRQGVGGVRPDAGRGRARRHAPAAPFAAPAAHGRPRVPLRPVHSRFHPGGPDRADPCRSRGRGDSCRVGPAGGRAAARRLGRCRRIGGACRGSGGRLRDRSRTPPRPLPFAARSLRSLTSSPARGGHLPEAPADPPAERRPPDGGGGAERDARRRRNASGPGPRGWRPKSSGRTPVSRSAVRLRLEASPRSSRSGSAGFARRCAALFPNTRSCA